MEELISWLQDLDNEKLIHLKLNLNSNSIGIDGKGALQSFFETQSTLLCNSKIVSSDFQKYEQLIEQIKRGEKFIDGRDI